MGSSVMIDVPSSRNDQTAEKEGADCDGLNIETCLLDLNRQCQGLGHELVNLSQLVSDKKESMGKLENMGYAVDNVEWSDGDVENEIKNGNVSDDGEEEEIGARELSKEIEILEAMLERGSFELLDLQTAMEEIEALKGSEKMTSEMEELESGLWELKRAIAELKGKKSKELKCWVTKEEGNLNWGSIIASVGAAVVAVTAMVFVGRATGVKFTAERGNKHRTG
ncbi:putative protein isoform X2 [Gossypium australe]|uniref:Uncharacterized protein n=1 Tax=Gossypium australe TaxID=47621 RepID=A0A5B6X9X3_9ROSI|nr:putative protein isoform X2 [Gossypium australe]